MAVMARTSSAAVGSGTGLDMERLLAGSGRSSDRPSAYTRGSGIAPRRRGAPPKPVLRRARTRDVLRAAPTPPHENGLSRGAPPAGMGRSSDAPGPEGGEVGATGPHRRGPARRTLSRAAL